MWSEVAPFIRTGFPLGQVDRPPGLGRRADRRHALVAEVGVVGRAAVKRRSNWYAVASVALL